jgi:outer membrane protein
MSRIAPDANVARNVRPPRAAPRGRTRVGLAGGAAISALLTLCPGVGAAETLYDAIQLAYQTNPALRSQQAQLRATDEGYVQARAGYGPQVNVTGQVAYDDTRLDLPKTALSPATTANYRATNESATISASQPIYTSGAVRSQVQAASANIAAGRQTLRQVEGQVILNVIAAYEDVRRDRQTLTILNSEIDALEAEYRETKARGQLGDLTNTDIAQSHARLVAARAQLVTARGQLSVSSATYLSVVGQSPGELAPEPDLPNVPATADQAFDQADRDNPQLLAAIEAEHAAEAQVRQAKSAFGPTVALHVDAGIAPYQAYSHGLYDRNVTVAATISQPLFTSGLNSSKVREALENDNRARIDIENVRRSVVQLVARSWDQLIATRGAIALQARQVELQTTAVQGNRVEQKVGLRSTIDLLNAELELANAQIALLQSRHDEYVARAGLLASTGKLEARYLLPGAPLYDPAASTNKNRDLFAPPWVGVVQAADRFDVRLAFGKKAIAPIPVTRPSVSGAEPIPTE